MSLWIISNILFTLSLSILLAPSPFTIGLTILSVALLVASIYASILSSWFAFLIYLIYVGGMLVIFSYFLALTPNQPSISRPFIPVFLITLFIILGSSFFVDMWSTTTSYFPQTRILFEPANCPILVLLVIVLLLAIIIVVKISARGQGPLRAFISYVQTNSNYSPSNQNCKLISYWSSCPCKYLNLMKLWLSFRSMLNYTNSNRPIPIYTLYSQHWIGFLLSSTYRSRCKLRMTNTSFSR